MRKAVEIKDPFPAWAWPMAWGWIEPYRAVALGDAGPQDQAAFVEYQMSNAGRWKTFGVWRDGELGGAVIFEPSGAGIWMIHIALKRTFWGGATSAAAAAISRMFEEAGARKVVGAFVDANRMARGLARRLGAVAEGRLRAQAMAGGAAVDVVVYGLLKGEWHGAVGLIGRRDCSGNRKPAADDQQLDDAGGGNVVRDGHADVHAGADESAGNVAAGAGKRGPRRRGRRNVRRDGGIQLGASGGDRGAKA